MTAWQWECFEDYSTPNFFSVTNAGPLLSPINTFKIARNDKLEIILETLVVGATKKSSAPVHPMGTVRLTTETVEFAGHKGASCTAHGVLPFHKSETYSPENVMQTTEKAQVHSFDATLRSDLTPTYTIDWLENLRTGMYVWRGSTVSDKQETSDQRTLGHGAAAIELSEQNITRSMMHFSALEMTINGTRLYISSVDLSFSKGCKNPGQIFYVGVPDDKARKKIREVLSFCLGNYLVYLGSTTLSEKSEVVAFSAVSPPSIGRIFEVAPLPPAPLHAGNQWVVDEKLLARMANAVHAHYDELRFNSLSWAYWHAMCAPVHMAAAHFGAAIEALQAAYIESHPGQIQKTLISDLTKWKKLKEALLKAIDDAGLDLPTSTIMKNKVASNMNQTPRGVLSDKLLTEIGIPLGPIENAAWKRRNLAAHGGEVNLDTAVATIMETKLLKIIMHRLVLKITSASDQYLDDYSSGYAMRKLTDPVPLPLPGAVT